ncbi:BA75_05199T0 [Komagataella pastoris]|uniref:BA75_05199T0 n=1 Tax=Komagataella pastoris TaxID=4922 RepID=A0A1B2JI12_PICPA|nr:BA75_05199T0 [Komagataella pastoris]
MGSLSPESDVEFPSLFSVDTSSSTHCSITEYAAEKRPTYTIPICVSFPYYEQKNFLSVKVSRRRDTIEISWRLKRWRQRYIDGSFDRPPDLASELPEISNHTAEQC